MTQTQQDSSSWDPENPISQLRMEYEQMEELFNAQSAIVQRFLELQAQQIGNTFIESVTQVRFKLPDRVAVDGKEIKIPPEYREQLIGGLRERLARVDLRVALRQRLADLESNSNKAVSTAAVLTRHAIASWLIHSMLPAGRSVNYQTIEGEEIPSVPVADALEAYSAITAATDAIAEESLAAETEDGRGELLVPFVPAARRYYLPQWVSFDDQGALLVNNTQEAEAHIASMQRFLFILHAAVALVPYIVADKEYQQKRYGMLGQLVNQGRALRATRFKRSSELSRTAPGPMT